VVIDPLLVCNPVDARPAGQRAESASVAQNPFPPRYLTFHQLMDALGTARVDDPSAASDEASGKF
jgi:hypothetical protein